MCGTIELKSNAMLAVRPELINEWDFEKNNELGLDVYAITKGSHTIAWWVCPDCKSSYDITIKNKTKGQNCPYCAGKRVNETNSLERKYPQLAKEWDFSKNKKKPSEISPHSGNKVWWICGLGHEYESVVRDRAEGNGCPVCASKQILIGFNDLWTTEPKTASLLANLDDGYKYTRQSMAKLDWKCPHCNHIIKNKSVYTVVFGGVSCPKCSDGRSYPEKFIYNLLLDLNVEFETEKIFNWLDTKRYDFYLPKYNAVIEVHGEQHYNRMNGMFSSKKTLEEEQANDKLKLSTALSNGIENYFVINASKSDRDFIKKSIIDSGVLELFGVNNNELDWDKYNKTSLPSMVKQASDLWNKGYYNSEIANELKVSLNTVCKYLKKGAEAGLCDYSPDNKRMPSNKSLYKKIVQLDLEGNFIREWKSITEAGNHYGSKRGGSISNNIKGKNKSAYGSIWKYAHDYYKEKQEV